MAAPIGTPVRVTFQLRGKDVTIRNMRHVNRQLVRRADSSTWNAAQHLKARSQAVVPYLTGGLYRSAFVRKVKDSDDVKMWAVGYMAEHALMVHEIPGRNHPTRGPSPEPKQDHYLSEPADQMRKEYPRRMRDDLADEVSRVRVLRVSRSR